MNDDPIQSDFAAADNASTVEKPPRNPAKPIAVGVILLLVVLVAGYGLLDRLTPSSNRGIVSAGVVQIAPRISGEVRQVHVSDDAVVQADDPLFSIDTRPFELAVRQAEANLASAAWVTMDLRENQLVDVEVDAPAQVVFDALPGHVFDGRVQSIAWGIDPGRNV